LTEARPSVLGRAARPASRLWTGLLDVVMPQTCVACGRWISGDARQPMCAPCWSALVADASRPYCRRCGRASSPLTCDDHGCGRCRKERFWNTAGMVRIGDYHVQPLQRLITAMKYRGERRALDLLVELLAQRLAQAPWHSEIELLVPVPMHVLRRWQRPCEHAVELARGLGERLGLPVRRAAVRRTRHTASQTGLISRRQRFLNVQGCFGPARRPGVDGKVVCVVDNLVVSGATLHEVAKVLRASGARRIYAAVAARTESRG